MSVRGRGRGRLSLHAHALQRLNREDPNQMPPRSADTSLQNRSPQEGEDARLAMLLNSEELTQLLECPVCYEIALPPVIMCTSGHNICSDCRSQCPRCPVCRSGFCEARNRLAENIVERCTVICRYKALGCDQILTGSLMAKHLDEECDFRPVLCRDCKVKVPFDQYVSHMLNVENLPKQIATECSTGFDIDEDDFSQTGSVSGQSWEPTWLYCYDTNFFCHMESNNSFWWIYVIAFADEALLDNYLCDILIWNRAKKQEMRYHGRIHSYRKSGDEILATGQCLITSQTAIRSILNQGGIDVVVCILRSTDFQSPTSRITNQPIYSPLTLRDVNNNEIPSITQNGFACDPPIGSPTPIPRNSTVVAEIPRIVSASASQTRIDTTHTGDGDYSQSQDSHILRMTRYTASANPPQNPPSPRNRLSRIDQITRSQLSRSRSLETGRRRRQAPRGTQV